MSLTRCLTKAGKTVDATAIRAARDAHLSDGMSHEDAARAAVQDHIDSLQQERADLAEKVAAQGGEVPEYAGEGPQFSRTKTDSPAFKEWFGDSKVVDADGNNGKYDSKNPDIAFSRTRRPQRLPVPSQGNVQAGRPAPTVQPARKLKVHEKVKRAISSPLTGILDEFEYRAKRGLLHGKLEETDTISRMMFDLFNSGSVQDRTEAYKYLTTKNARPDLIADPEIKQLAIETKAAFEQLGQKALALGTLSQKSYDKYGGAYLPRLYLRHLMPDTERAAIGAGKAGNFGWAKQRKDLDQYTRKYLLGEIKDPGFLAAKGFAAESRDLHFLDFLEAISKNPNWVLQNDFLDYEVGQGTPHARNIRTTVVGLDNRATELEQMAAVMDPAEAAVTRAEAARMRAAVAAWRQTNASHQEGVDQSKYKRIPNSKKYGDLAGMHVLKEIHEDLINVGATQPGDSWMEQMAHPGGPVQKGVSLWKWGKVVANPPAQVRNFISNGVLLHLSGVPFHRVPQRAVQAYLAMRGKGRYGVYRKLASKHGLMHTTFKLQEIGKFDEELLGMLDQNGNLTKAQSARSALVRLAKAVYNGLGAAYQWSEAFWKVAAMIDGMEGQGMSEEAAAQFANEALFDYSDVGQTVNAIRKSPFGAPFITFQVKATARIVENLSHPVKAARFLPYVAILYGLQAAVAESLDVDDDDIEKLKKALPEWLRNRGHTLMFPWKDDHGNWQFADISYFLPWTQLAALGKGIASGDAKAITRETGLLGGPLLSLASAVKTNIDPFTEKPIADPFDPPSAQLASWLGYLWNLAMPAPITGTGMGGKILEAAGGSLNKYGEPATTPMQAALRTVGVNVYGVDAPRARQENIKWMNYEVSKVKSRMNKLLKDKNLDAEEKRALRAKYMKEMARRKKEIREYAAESQIPAKLR